MAEVVHPMPTCPTPDRTVASSDQAVTIEGRSYDICVLQGQCVLLLVENIEDVKAPGLLYKLAWEKQAGCSGMLLEQSTGICCPVVFPLEEKGIYTFTPHEREGVFMETIEKATGYLARALTTSFMPDDNEKSN
ncbi:g1180 [Coccomyxa viridis]|uniref:G1180 protein n=1 Tax=Coccomyxa viridis TaxID=1274662 RepID=A0ABP1FHJ1_9CHLO